MIELTTPRLAFAHGRLLQPAFVSHPDGPSPDGNGWGVKPWQRRPGTILSRSLDLLGGTVTSKLLDVRPSVLLYSNWRTLRTHDPAGVPPSEYAAADVGATYSYVRAAAAWCRAFDGRLVQADANEELFQEDGQIFQWTATNRCPRSSFVSGTTGWTLQGTGVNGSAIAADTTDLMWDTAVTGNSLKFTAGNPHAANLRALVASADNVPASANVFVYFFHTEDSTTTFEWQLQRAVDSWWWNDSTPGWQAGEVANALTTVTTKPTSGAIPAQVSKIIPIGGSATAVTVYIRIPSGGTASRTGHVYHVQVESDALYPSAPIVTNGASVTRNQDELTLTTSNPPHTWNVQHGTMLYRFKPFFLPGDLGANALFTMLGRYNAITDELDTQFFTATTHTFRRRTNNVNYDATASISGWARGSTHIVGARWCSEQGELNLAPYTASTFIDGVKGTDAVPTRTPIASGTIALYVGSADTTLFRAGGVMSDLLITPLVLSDEEIADLSAEMLT